MRLQVVIGLGVALCIGAAAPVVRAQTKIDLPAPVCGPPISLCQKPYLTNGVDDFFDGCPAGYECTCVPSCQACDDCAAEVCVPEQTTCDDRVAEVTEVIESVVARTNHCTRNEDCVLISTGTQCLGTCGAFVNQKYARIAAGVIRRADARICEGFLEDGCPYALPGCTVPAVECVESRCVRVFVPR